MSGGAYECEQERQNGKVKPKWPDIRSTDRVASNRHGRKRRWVVATGEGREC